MKNHKISRKQFLKYSGAALSSSILASPFSVLLNSIMKSSISSAFAADGGRPRKWLDIRFDLAPPRFVYDLFLQNLASDKANFVANPYHTFTKFEAVNGRYVSGKYETNDMKALGKSTREVWAPHIWKLNVPAAGGGTRPMSDLLKYFLNVRAIDTGNPSHDGAAQLHYLPLGAQQSVPALSADGSLAPIAGVLYSATNYAFRSIASNSFYPVGGTDLVASLLAPFDPTYNLSTVRGREAQIAGYLDAVRAGLRADSFARHQDSAAVHKAIEGARDLMGGSVTQLKAQWAPLLAKYKAIMAQAIATPIPGINDKPIGIAANLRKPGTAGTAGAGAYDLIGVPVLNNDVEEIIVSQTYIPRMAEAFAIAEFILLNNLSDSITVSIAAITNLNIISSMGGTAKLTGTTFDEHTTGGMLSTFLNAVQAVAHAACMLELIDKLIAAGQWSNTVINSSGEFNRIPRGNGVGSDHLYQGASLALYSGIIDGPHILGDIGANPSPAAYNGTSGLSVPQAGLATENTRIDVGNAAATIAQLLGVKSPVTAREPLVLVRGNSIFPRIPPGKIVK